MMMDSMVGQSPLEMVRDQEFKSRENKLLKDQVRAYQILIDMLMEKNLKQKSAVEINSYNNML